MGTPRLRYPASAARRRPAEAPVPRRHSLNNRAQVAAAALLPALTVVFLARDTGGWYPPAWDWAALVLLLIGTSTLLLLDSLPLQRLDRTLVLAFAALAVWTGLSWSWSESKPQSELELERTLMYAAGVAAFLLVARRTTVRVSLAALLLADVAISCYALGSRLFPNLVTFGVNGARLAGPVAYPNGLGILAVGGLLLALGLVLDEEQVMWRTAAAAGVPPLSATLYFTFSRGAWLSLLAGAAVALLLTPARRRFLIAVAGLVAFVAFSVWISSRSAPLTLWNNPAAAEPDGRRLAIALCLTMLAAGGTAYALAARRVYYSRWPLVPAAALLLLIAAAATVSVHRTAAKPAAPARTSTSSATAPHSSTPTAHLFTTSGDNRLEYWRVALDDLAGHPLQGSGAGTFGVEWLANRHVDESVQDAHNLYLETAAELGLVGLSLLALALVIPLVAALRIRGTPVAVGAVGAYAALLAHAGVDWDWELPAVMWSGLFCGIALVVAARQPGEAITLLTWKRRSPPVAVAAGLMAFMFVCLVGNGAYQRALRAAWAGDWQTARTQAERASSWTPWSAEALAIRADAAAREGDRGAAVALIRRAVRKDPQSWDLWDRLASVTRGAERRRALERMRLLNPREAPR